MSPKLKCMKCTKYQRRFETLDRLLKHAKETHKLEPITTEIIPKLRQEKIG